MKLSILKVIFALVFLSIVIGTIWLFIVGRYEVAAITLVLSVMFGIFVVIDIRKALKKRDP